MQCPDLSAPSQLLHSFPGRIITLSVTIRAFLPRSFSALSAISSAPEPEIISPGTINSLAIVKISLQSVQFLKTQHHEARYISHPRNGLSAATDFHRCDGSSSMCTSDIQVQLPADEALLRELRKSSHLCS